MAFLYMEHPLTLCPLRAMSTIEESAAASAAQNVALWDIFTTFVRISVMSFGGSTSAWTYRAVVEERKWLDNDAFVAGMTLSQVMPGSNPVNVSLYVGQRLRGPLGALVGALGMISPAFVVVLVLAVLYTRLSGYPLTHFLLLGIAAAGVGATFSMGAKVAVRIERKLLRYAFAIIAFVAVGVLHWPTVPVVLVLAPLSIVCAAMEN
jgi:chromate transporter